MFLKHKKEFLFLFIALLIVWGLTDVRSRASLDPLHVERHHTDLTVYTEAGAAFFDGRDPYEVTSPRGWYYLYPPLFALMMAPLHSLDPQWQGVVWFGISLAMAWGCVYELRRLLDFCGLLNTQDPRMRRWVSLASWCAFAASLLPSLDCLQRGQVGLAKAWLVFLGFRLVLEGTRASHWLVGGLVLALPCVLKVIPCFTAAVLLLMLFAGGVRRKVSGEAGMRFKSTLAGFVAGGVLFVFLIPAGLVGWQANLQHLKTWSDRIGSKSEGIEGTQYFGNPFGIRNQSLSNSLFWSGNVLHNLVHSSDHILYVDTLHPSNTFMGKPASKKIVSLTRLAMAGLIMVLAWRAARNGDPLIQIAVFGLICIVTLMISPVARGHYFMYMAPAWLFVPLVLARRNQERLAQWLAWLAPVPVILHYLFPLTLGRMGLLGVWTAIWLLVAGVLMNSVLSQKKDEGLAPLADGTG